MSDLQKLPVEPLDERRWERVEAELFARVDGRGETHTIPPGPRRPAYRSLAALVAVAAAAGVVIAFAVGRGPTDDETGSLRISSGVSPAQSNLGEVTVTLEASSDLTAVGSDADGWHVILERGATAFEVPPRRDRPPFVVLAGAVRVEVIGTRFTVRREDPYVAVEVVSGLVRVIDGDTSDTVGAGERWTNRVVSAAASAEVPATAVAAPDVTSAEVASPRVGAREAAPTAVSRTHEEERTPRVASEAPSERARFEHAASIEATDPDAALATYADIERGRGPWAANALYARGRLLVETHHRAEARAALERYLREYPGGPNAADVRELLAAP